MQGANCDAVRALLAVGNTAERRLWKSEITRIYWGLLMRIDVLLVARRRAPGYAQRYRITGIKASRLATADAKKPGVVQQPMGACWPRALCRAGLAGAGTLADALLERILRHVPAGPTCRTAGDAGERPGH